MVAVTEPFHLCGKAGEAVGVFLAGRFVCLVPAGGEGFLSSGILHLLGAMAWGVAHALWAGSSIDAVESVTAEMLFGEYTVDASVACAGFFFGGVNKRGCQGHHVCAGERCVYFT